jgi:hypothetical protein
MHLSACGAFGVCTQAVLLSNTNIPLKRAAQTYCGGARQTRRTFPRSYGFCETFGTYMRLPEDPVCD